MKTDTVRDSPAGEPLLVVTRVFDAPRALVYACYTDPAAPRPFLGAAWRQPTIAHFDLAAPAACGALTGALQNGSGFGYTSVYLELVALPNCIVYRDAPDDWKCGLDGLPAGRNSHDRSRSRKT